MQERLIAIDAIDLDLDNNKTSVNLLSDLSNKGIKVRVLYIKKLI